MWDGGENCGSDCDEGSVEGVDEAGNEGGNECDDESGGQKDIGYCWVIFATENDHIVAVMQENYWMWIMRGILNQQYKGCLIKIQKRSITFLSVSNNKVFCFD